DPRTWRDETRLDKTPPAPPQRGQTPGPGATRRGSTRHRPRPHSGDRPPDLARRDAARQDTARAPTAGTDPRTWRDETRLDKTPPAPPQRGQTPGPGATRRGSTRHRPRPHSGD